jgi:tetratricopeptide (TPR) repeat protein
MQFRGSVIFTAVVLSFAVAASAQKPASSTPPPAPPTNGNTNGSTNPRQPASTFPNDSTVPQVIYISGTVVLSDGLPLPERAKIERVCGGPPHVETYTDKKGHFSFQVGQNLEMQDASSPSSFNGPGSPLGNMNTNGGSSGRGGFNERELWGCELKADLPGFQSDRVPLTNIHYMDNPDIGTIILHRLGKVDGLTISVVSALAPKDARKAYEKGQAASGKRNWDEAQKDFEKAVEIYPKYSVAWFDLGRLQEENGHFDDARKAYQQAIDAEPKYIQPFERLSWLALRESKWQDLVDRTDQWLRLDPLNSADVYYLSSLGNLQTQHIDIAEKNAREAIRLDPARKNMRTRYILGLALAQKQDFVGAAAAVREYLAAANPEAKETEVIRKQLDQIDDAAKQQTAAAKPQ